MVLQCPSHHGTSRKIHLYDTQDNLNYMLSAWQLQALPSCPRGLKDQYLSSTVTMRQ